MRQNLNHILRISSASALLLGASFGASTMVSSSAAPVASDPAGVFQVEIAEDATRFVFDETPLHDDGTPAYGGEFVTQGYLYPVGTLSQSDGVYDGVLPDGSPEFPDRVIGEWTCYGTHVGDGAHTTTGPWVVTKQVFDFGDVPGENMVVTEGLELVDLNVPIRRAVAGTTGRRFRRVDEQVQAMVGFNAQGGVTLLSRLVSSSR